MIDLTGKRAVVTGGARGIGGATSRLLGSRGAHVAISYRTRAAEAEALVAELRNAGVRALAHRAEMGDRASVDAFFERVHREWGGIDIFVGNAGVWPADEVAAPAITDERWHCTMDANVHGMFYSTRAALRQMDAGGRIVLISSTAGQRGESMHADYAASKGAVIAFVKSVAVEVAPRQITCNSVAPGWVDTEMCEQPFAGDGRSRIAAGIPVGRVDRKSVV